MNLIELFFITNIFVLFPMILYIVFIGFKEKFKDYETNIYLELFLYLITFTLLYIYNKFDIDIYICFFSIPILLSLHANRKLTAIILSIIIITCFCGVYKYDVAYFVFIISLYFISDNYYRKRNKSRFFLTTTFAIITTFSILLYSIIYKALNPAYVFIIFSYNISIYLITYSIIKVKNTLKLYVSLEEYENDKMLKTYIFKVTHEIKNPLTVIKGYLSIMDTNDIEKSSRYKKILQSEVENSLNVLKDFSEINHLSLIKEKMDFNKLLNEINETIIPFFNNKNITFNIKSNKNLIVYADYNRLKQVLVNLIKNSTEAIDNSGNISLNAKIKNNHLILTIKDDGHGMDKDTIDNLFTPFYSKKSYGNGLGLCISKEIIERHNGTIKYTSIVSKGTTVKIEFPINY